MFGMVLHLNVIQAMFEGDGGQSSQSQDEKRAYFHYCCTKKYAFATGNKHAATDVQF